MTRPTWNMRQQDLDDTSTDFKQMKNKTHFLILTHLHPKKKCKNAKILHSGSPFGSGTGQSLNWAVGEFVSRIR